MSSILVVDDDEGMRVTIEASLNEHEVCCVASAVLAQPILNSQHFDVVLCDLMMPEMTGAELYEAVRADSAHRRAFIFMTGGSLPIAVQSYVALAEPVVLKKPFTVQQLREVVTAVLSQPCKKT